MEKNKIYALILAGGRSSRMGMDKAIVTIDHSSMLERAIAFWRDSDQVSRILVAAGTKDHRIHVPEDVTIIYDQKEGCGPMMGILSAFEETDAEVLYVSAVDMPFLQKQMMLPIPEAQDAAIYRIGGKNEPLFGVYKRSCMKKAAELLSEGKGKMALLLEAVDTVYYDLTDQAKDIFENINTPRELQMARAGHPPMIGIAGWSGSGKTTFIEKLIRELKARGLRVNVIKHDAHGFQMDHEGKDTWRFSRAGADGVGIIGPDGWALLGRGSSSPDLMRQAMLAGLGKEERQPDLILVEGYKNGPLPKLEIHRQAAEKPLIVSDDTLLAYVTDEKIESTIQNLPLNDPSFCADYLMELLLS